jgi:hypothetical protein
MNLLSVSADAKTIKGEKKGYLTGILYLLPADSSGLINLCTNATPGCKASCLNTAGRGQMSNVQAGRMRKTKWLVEDSFGFHNQLAHDIELLVKQAKAQGLKPCVRINGTSDLPKIAMCMANIFNEVQFYDYTKHPHPWLRTSSNYHLTFSLSESNASQAFQCLDHSINVAVVFNIKKSEPLPKTYWGYKVINGDESDLRFKDPKGVIVGLKAKGRAKKDCTGFVQQVDDRLIQIGGIR